MTFVTRSEFRQVLLALYGDIHKLRDQIRTRSQRQDTGQNPAPSLIVRAELDATSSIETRTSANDQESENRYRFKNLLVQWATFVAVFGYGAIAMFQLCAMRDANYLTRQLVRDTYAADISVAIGFEGHIAQTNGVEAQVNVGFDNHGKHRTTSVAQYEIWLEARDGKRIRTLKSEFFEDRVPPVGRTFMPNHYFFIESFSRDELTDYGNSTLIIKAKGNIRYDDGFGTEVNEPFCVATTAYSYMPCDGVERYMRSLPKKP